MIIGNPNKTNPILLQKPLGELMPSTDIRKLHFIEIKKVNIIHTIPIKIPIDPCLIQLDQVRQPILFIKYLIYIKLLAPDGF